LLRRKGDQVAGATRNIAGATRNDVTTLFHDERINRPLRELVSRPATLREYLSRITDDPVIKVRLPQAVELARKLTGMLPDLNVLPLATAMEKYPERREMYTGGDYAGLYDPRHDVIVLNPGATETSLLTTILHDYACWPAATIRSACKPCSIAGRLRPAVHG
jgi:hypothetical protein